MSAPNHNSTTTHDAPTPPAIPDTIRQIPTPSDPNSPFPLPIFTPNRPQPALPPRQLAAIALLSAGKSTASVAATLGVHRSTLHAWKKDPTFSAELRARQSELADTIQSRLDRLLLHATHTALASLKTPDQNTAHRNAFRLLSVLRPWSPHLTPRQTPPATLSSSF